MTKRTKIPSIPEPKDWPLDPIARRSVGDEVQSARDAWGVLAVMANAGRMDALVFLLGLGHTIKSDLDRRRDLATAIGSVDNDLTADWLANEFLTIESTRASRTYLRDVVEKLCRMRGGLGDSRLEKIMGSKRVSKKWKDTIREIAWRWGH